VGRWDKGSDGHIIVYRRSQARKTQGYRRMAEINGKCHDGALLVARSLE